MDNAHVASWLESLLRYMHQEKAEWEEFSSSCTLESEQRFQQECKEIEETISELQKPQTCICRELTIDEAIEHAREVSQRDSSACSKQHGQLADWLEQLKTLNGQYASLCNDFISLKSRMQKEKDLAREATTKELLLGVLSVVDDMERLLAEEVHFRDVLDETTSMDAGYELIVENMMKFLKDAGCTKAEAEPGMQFDVNFHEAISTKKIDETSRDYFKPNDIAEVLQTGWLLDGKLLRAAKVITYA